MSDRTYEIQIPIGDWSDDGHGKCVWYIYESSHDVESVRDAYHTACERYPRLSPEKICSEYDQCTVPKSTWDDIVSIIPSIASLYTEEMSDESVGFEPDTMAAYTVAFIALGNSEISMRMKPLIPSLTNYGLDSKGRHIGRIGYGLFS